MKSKARRNAWWVLSSILVGTFVAVQIHYTAKPSGDSAVWGALLVQGSVTYFFCMVNYACGGGEE